jgi:hypothetical protein
VHFLDPSQAFFTAICIAAETHLTKITEQPSNHLAEV